MTCERYWREGIVLVERGLDDPHRDGCADCTCAHASRQELVEALPLIGAGYTGDPRWQAEVWRRIDGKRTNAPWRWRWQFAGALTVACAIALWIGLGRRGDARPRFDTIPGATGMRSHAAHAADASQVDDHRRFTVGETSEVWFYRAERLVLRCRPRELAVGCAPDAHGMIVEMVLSAPGEYEAIAIEAPVAEPRGVLDQDQAALATVGAVYKVHLVTVR